LHRALIVDDSASIRAIVGFTLRAAGFEVVEGVDGQDGLHKLDGGSVDVIITDLNMPVMDGITFIKHVRARPGTKYTPLLMLTTESQASMKQLGKSAGATGWIVKPVHPEKLLEVIDKVLPARRKA
jgi:two-component system, chemotaxis family, chemotaxis protein CheY